MNSLDMGLQESPSSKNRCGVLYLIKRSGLSLSLRRFNRLDSKLRCQPY
jgi:hypothetical protein